MLRIGQDLHEHDLPSLVRESFLNDSSYLHISDTGLNYLDLDQQLAKIRSISQEIGHLTLSSADPQSDIWLLDSRTSPNAKLITAHTDNPFKDKPEDVVAFWNIRSSSQGGENVITPVDRILELGDQSSYLAKGIQKAQFTDFTFTHHEKSWSGKIIDTDKQAIRYDAKHLTNPSSEVTDLFKEAVKIGDIIKLAPGDVLFFNNKTNVHARLPYSDPCRLSIRTRIDL